MPESGASFTAALSRKETLAQPIRVLILEDHPADAELMLHELRRAGFNPDWRRVETEADFLAHLGSELDVILADYSLPQFDAPRALQHLQERGLNIPFIIVSGNIGEDQAVLAMKGGATDYLLKDRPARLGLAVRQALEQKRLRDEKRRAEAALRESEERYRQLVELSPELIAIHSEGNLVFINTAGARLLGAANPAQLFGRPVIDFVHPEYREVIEQRQQQARAGTAAPFVEAKLIQLDATEVAVEVAAMPFTYCGQPAVQVVCRDITERKRAAERLESSLEQLRALAAHLQSVREEERTHIAREIHDELGQALTGLKFDLHWLGQRLVEGDSTSFGPLQEKMQSALRLIDTLIQTVRRIATGLRPGVLDDLGLVAAIEWQAGEFQTRTGIRCEISSLPAELDLDPSRATALFRIFQETLTNVARHAQATRVSISLQEQGSKLVLEVGDNGRGITERELAAPESLGLLGMRERALLFGGEVSICGQAGGGTRITAWLPLGKPKVKRETRQSTS